MSEIVEVRAREILDSRGNPTVEVDVLTAHGFNGRAAVPSGASTGSHEAVELRDGNQEEYLGKGVKKAVNNVNSVLGQELIGLDVSQQKKVDEILLQVDGTENKSKYGANAILGISLACAKAAAAEANLPLYRYLGGVGAYQLPVPLMNILNGGAHANNGVDVQEFMIAPIMKKSFRENLRAGAEIFQNLKKLLAADSLSTAVGDEGGFAPNLASNEEALSYIAKAIEKAGYRMGEDILLALDVASTEFYKNDKYQWEGKDITALELGEIYSAWASKYPLFSIEDAFAEDDWAAWTQFTRDHGSKLQLVGDDLFVTNPKRIQRGIEENAANAVLVKINQIGSLSETCEAVELSHKAGFRTVMSHRSGETEDTSIADLAVALGSSQIKTGSLCRSERIAKYNQLLRIEEELGDQARYVGDLRSK
tara:strand:- start:6612 stop:7880 length:1269 start_codon:yes stop_codon:yes gene_type:complete